MNRLVSLFVVTALSGFFVACGGGRDDSAPPVTKAPEATPGAQEPQTPDDGGQPARSFGAVVFAEQWGSLLTGGSRGRRPESNPCAGQETDPGSGDERPRGTKPDRWIADWGAPGATVSDGHLHIDYTTGGVAAWSLLSGALFDRSVPLRAETTIDLQPGPGAWVGITFHAGEGDYRELALYSLDGLTLHAGAWAPCFYRPELAQLQPGSRRVALEYTPPPADVCWRYYVDDALIREERCDDLGAPLVTDPRVGVFVANLWVEGKHMAQGRVRATLGPVVVERGG